MNMMEKKERELDIFRLEKKIIKMKEEYQDLKKEEVKVKEMLKDKNPNNVMRRGSVFLAADSILDINNP